jgi:hypothetical protein
VLQFLPIYCAVGLIREVLAVIVAVADPIMLNAKTVLTLELFGCAVHIETCIGHVEKNFLTLFSAQHA